MVKIYKAIESPKGEFGIHLNFKWFKFTLLDVV